MLLTFVIGKLQVVVHCGHKLLNDKTSYDRCQVTFTHHFPVKDLYVVICRGKIKHNMIKKRLKSSSRHVLKYRKIQTKKTLKMGWKHIYSLSFVEKFWIWPGSAARFLYAPNVIQFGCLDRARCTGSQSAEIVSASCLNLAIRPRFCCAPNHW